MKYKYEWNPDNGVSKCFIYDKGLIFTGEAHCHPEDMNYASERTGCYIAETRACIARLRHKRDNVLRPQVKSLMTFYKDLKNRKNFNADNPEIHYLIQRINELNHELAIVEQDIRLEQTYLYDYIHNKEIIYKKIR